MWSHDEGKHINGNYAAMATVRCPHCYCINRKYVESHYTGGAPCVLLARYCRNCSKELRQ